MYWQNVLAAAPRSNRQAGRQSIDRWRVKQVQSVAAWNAAKLIILNEPHYARARSMGFERDRKKRRKSKSDESAACRRLRRRAVINGPGVCRSSCLFVSRFTARCILACAEATSGGSRLHLQKKIETGPILHWCRLPMCSVWSRSDRFPIG